MSAVTGDQRQQATATGSRGPLPVPRALLRMRSDAALAERVTGGDEAAFDVLYERHRAVVLAVAMGVLGTTHDAEDATQETFSALAVALRTKPPAELRPWLIRVARNAAIDTTRRRRHRLLTLDGEIPEAPARPSGGGKAELAVVFDGIRELPEGQRMALLMRELGGHTYSEIADFLETDEEAVKGLIARARVGLRAFREASELSCASARTTIAAEPDGRRYDRTIRRHLRACASCRSYRDALRDDAKALRAGLPLQAGGVAAGTGIGAGPLAAAKGAMVGYSLTQAAATCAASACAVGAVGGMVLIGPVHSFGLPTILPAAKHARAHKPEPKLAARANVEASTHPRITLHASGGAVAAARPRASEAAPHAAAPSRVVVALKHHHSRRQVAVKHSTPRLKAAPTGGTSALSPTAGAPNPITSALNPTTSTPSSSPPSSSPVTKAPQPQPVTQGSRPEGKATAATSTGTSSQSQSAGAGAGTTQGAGSNGGAAKPPASGTNVSSAASDAIASRAVQEATEEAPGTSSNTASNTSSGSPQPGWSQPGWYQTQYGDGYGSANQATTGTATVTTGTPGQNAAPGGGGTTGQTAGTSGAEMPGQDNDSTSTGMQNQNTDAGGAGTLGQSPGSTGTGTPSQDSDTTGAGTQTSTDTPTTFTSTTTPLGGSSAPTATNTTPSVDG